MMRLPAEFLAEMLPTLDMLAAGVGAIPEAAVPKLVGRAARAVYVAPFAQPFAP